MTSPFRLFIVALVVLIIGLQGCAPDQREVFKDQLLETDRQFSAMSQREGIGPAFLQYMDDHATIYREGALPYTGREALTGLYAKPSSAQLSWKPTFADCAASGDLGYTMGEWTIKRRDEQGAEKTSNGFYVSIWKRQADGSWKYVFDSGINGPEQEK
jgi:ketosteroid isomerase-like protein